jgi:hypothetical protein
MYGSVWEPTWAPIPTFACVREPLTCWNPQIQVQGTTARRLLHWRWFFSNSIAQKRPHTVTSGRTCRCFPRLAMWLAG